MVKKVLIKGNHDQIANASEYLEYFDDIRGCETKMLPNIGKAIVQHIPCHPSQLNDRYKVCLHGHLHSKSLPDNRYFNVSCEVLNYTPIHIEQISEVLISKGIV